MAKGHNKLGWLALASLLALCVPIPAQGALINIILADVDAAYAVNQVEDTGLVFDVLDSDGGNLMPGESDLLASATFELDGGAPPASGGNNTLMSSPGNNLFIDLLVDGITPTDISLGSFHTDLGSGPAGFGIDVFNNDFQLRLNTTTIDMLVDGDAWFFRGEATLASQNLPFGLQLDPNMPIKFSFTATDPSVNAAATTSSMFSASGAFTITGTQIPEPNSCLLFVSMAGVFAIANRRRRQS